MIHHGEIEFRGSVTALCGFRVEVGRFAGVGRNAVAILVFYGEIDFFLGSEGFQIPITPKKVLLDYTASDSDCYPDRFDTDQGLPGPTDAAGAFCRLWARTSRPIRLTAAISAALRRR